MLDPLTSLTFSVHSSKGIYALLLGSGISTAAAIPTGWDITLDLVGKVAASSGEDCGIDVVAWYKAKFKSDPDYSTLLDTLAKTRADRANLLSSYFEPTADDLEKGLKAPTLAHKSIARLVANGYVRVILTTNFDRLMERALETEGISPTVISTSDGARGALPLAHAKCTLVKVNGDYRDTRIRNTVAELGSYEAEMDQLLDRIFDEYGLIVCGWSATWDVALCRALMRSPNRRFTTYWTRRTTLTKEAQAIVVQRQAVELEIESGDALFTSIETKLDAIERYSRPHPASAKLAVMSLKKFIAQDKYRVELRDLVASEAERAFAKLAPLPTLVANIGFNDIAERVKICENVTETLTYLLAHGGFWGRPEHRRLWRDAIARLAKLKRVASGNSHLLSLQIYPACLMFYAASLGAIAGRNWETVKELFRDIFVEDNGELKPLIRVVLPWSALQHSIAKQLPGSENRRTPMSDRIFDALREPMREYTPDDSDYADTFDLLEYLAALVHLDLRLLSPNETPHAPIGRFFWRPTPTFKSVVDQISEDAARQGDEWTIIRAEIFPSLSRFREVEKHYREKILPMAYEL